MLTTCKIILNAKKVVARQKCRRKEKLKKILLRKISKMPNVLKEVFISSLVCRDFWKDQMGLYFGKEQR